MCCESDARTSLECSRALSTARAPLRTLDRVVSAWPARARETRRGGLAKDAPQPLSHARFTHRKTAEFASIPATMYLCVLMLTGQGEPDGELSTPTKVICAFTALFSVAMVPTPRPPYDTSLSLVAVVVVVVVVVFLFARLFSRESERERERERLGDSTQPRDCRLERGVCRFASLVRACRWRSRRRC